VPPDPLRERDARYLRFARFAVVLADRRFAGRFTAGEAEA
jgi:hypothetical protein